MKSLFSFKRIVSYLLVGVLLSSFSIDTARAFNNVFDERFYSSNNILHYNPEDICLPSAVVLSGKDNREKIFNFLKSKGLNDNQAVGVLGNLQKESGYSPTRHEEGKAFEEGGYGIAQWTFGRRTSLKEYLDTNTPELVLQYYNDNFGGGTSEADGFIPKNSATGELMPLADNDALLMAELAFLIDETTSRRISRTTASVTSATVGDNEWEALKKATSIEDATKIWLYNFEIPADIAQAAIDRTTASTTLLAQLQSGSGSSTASLTGCADTTSGDTTALQATVKLYAWPEYHSAPYVTPKNEYKLAVDKAKASGGYVGGIDYAGIDCGGFVTRVMIDSGFEPQYNSQKGPTGTQKVWLDANWENLGKANTIDTATLKPGDVAMTDGHTFMFAGTNIDGFGNTNSYKGVASASLDQRAPMAGDEPLTDSTYTWYRKKVVSNE